MNWTASDTIMAATQVLAFFLEILIIIIIVSEMGDKSNVTCNWGPQKRVCKEKSFENPDLTDSPHQE